MLWMLTAFALLVLYCGMWVVIIGGAEDDDEAARQYQREREAFERLFK